MNIVVTIETVGRAVRYALRSLRKSSWVYGIGCSGDGARHRS